MTHYYEDLSADSSSSSSSSEDDDPSIDSHKNRKNSQHKHNHTTNDLGPYDAASSQRDSDRFILHMDVDCFYCQCECIDRNISHDRPLAIGQKHIVVTCNYAARSCGVTKLQSRQDALTRCPHLFILEGSDLERYRIHARNIYQAFRKACQQSGGIQVAVCKGSMDEAMADLTPAVAIMRDESEWKDATTLTMDLNFIADVAGRTSSPPPRDTQLEYAGSLARRIRQKVLEETQFHTTMGLSINPMLAKIASGHCKPGIVNILTLEHAQQLLPDLSLRKIPGLGRSTYKALQPCLERQAGSGPGSSTTTSKSWTCRDLLRVPLEELAVALESVRGLDQTFTMQARTLLDKCRGLDFSRVVDDHGGLARTLSVENSFRRDSVTTIDAVHNAMCDLYVRLPRLLRERTLWSPCPEKAFPHTIRLTARFVVDADADAVRGGGRRRHTVTKSKQSPVTEGDKLLTLDTERMADLMRRLVLPLLQALVFRNEPFNVTRLNVALANFQDMSLPEAHPSVNLVATGSPLNVDSSLPRSSNEHFVEGRNKSIPEPSGKRRRIDQFFVSKAKI